MTIVYQPGSITCPWCEAKKSDVAVVRVITERIVDNVYPNFGPKDVFLLNEVFRSGEVSFLFCRKCGNAFHNNHQDAAECRGVATAVAKLMEKIPVRSDNLVEREKRWTCRGCGGQNTRLRTKHIHEGWFVKGGREIITHTEGRLGADGGECMDCGREWDGDERIEEYAECCPECGSQELEITFEEALVVTASLLGGDIEHPKTDSSEIKKVRNYRCYNCSYVWLPYGRY